MAATRAIRSSNTLLLRFILVSLVLFISQYAFSQTAEIGKFRFGGMAGQVGLLGEPGSEGTNALGFGGMIGFRLDERIALDLGYIASSHPRVNHGELLIGADYYLGDYQTASPHLSAGMSFIHNGFKDEGISGDAAGIYFGGGLEFELQRGLTIGPELRYVKAFEATGRVDNESIKTVEDSYSLLIRVMYQLNSD